MHIIPPPSFSIPLLLHFAGKHGRSPHVLCPARSDLLPGGGLSLWQEGGGGVRVH